MPGVSSLDVIGGVMAPMQIPGLQAAVEAPAPVRAAAGFALVAAIGGLLLWRYEPFLDRSIEASMATPLRSIAYGVAAHAVIAFAGVYLASQLTRYGVFGSSGTLVAGGLGAIVLLLAASLGFTVVGSIIAELGGPWGRWVGLAAGAVIAGLAAFLGPMTGAVLWFVVVSMGIGGPARRWLHADAVEEL